MFVCASFMLQTRGRIASRCLTIIVAIGNPTIMKDPFVGDFLNKVKVPRTKIED